MTQLLFCLMMVVSIYASDVIELDNRNFDREVKKYPVLLVEFYAPWCGHCKNLAPEYEAAATSLKEKDIPIAKIDVDNEKNRPLASRFGIRSFPTLKVFKNGEYLTDYKGPRDSYAIQTFMLKMALPMITIFKSKEEAQSFISQNDVNIIGFFEKSISPTFETTAKSLHVKFSFGAVIDNPELTTSLDCKVNSVVMFKKFDEKRLELSPIPSSPSQFSTWIKDHGTELIGEAGPDNYQSYIDLGLPLVWVFVDPSQEGQKEQTLSRFQPLALETKGKLTWIWADWTRYARHGERLGISGTVPALAIDDNANGKHYVREKDLDVDSTRSWISMFLSGSLVPTMRSEEAPISNDGPITKVVATTFEQIVLNREKDVFVEFYAPWCGHCKALAPIYEELGQAFHSDPGIVIAQMDGTLNDMNPRYNVRGFPTLKFFPADSKNKPLDYNGDRTLEAMKEFIQKHRKTTSP